jgi:hypothetical protein
MTQQQGGRDEDAPGGVTDTGDGTGGTLGTGTGGPAKSGGVTDTGDGTGGSFGSATGGKGKAGGKGAADKMVEGMSESGKDPEKPLKR